MTARTHGRGWKQWSWAPAVIVGVVIGITWCLRTPREPTLEDLILRFPCDEMPTVPGLVATALTGESSYENEVHDCQRLVRADGSFGPLMGIFPLDSAMDVPEVGDSVLIVAASVFNWGVGADHAMEAYEPLMLRDRWSCLWLKREHASWSAAVWAAPATGCPGSPPPPATAFALEVTESRHPEGGYPKTGRWRFDRGSSLHYIGIKCGDAWCSVWAPESGLALPAQLTGPRHRSIPGFYDEQNLAVEVTDGRLRPGPWGRIYPSPELEAADSVQLAAGMVAARIEIDATEASAPGFERYVEKFALTEVKGVYVADVWLSTAAESGLYAPPPGVTSGSARNAKGFRYIHHKLHSAVGAVRWRWLETDELPWISCRQGCCTLEEAM